jgi:predicted nucleotidyltransferase
VACECHDHDHDLDVWIESESDPEVREVTLTFYKELETPWWESGFNRFREAWRILVHGRSRFSATIILKQDVAQNLINTIQNSIERLERSSDNSRKL